MSRVDIQNYSQKLENEIQRIKTSPKIKEKDQQHLLNFIQHRKLNAGDGRITSETSRLRKIAENNPENTLEKIKKDKETLEKILIQIENSKYYQGEYTNSTKDEYNKAVKRFLEYIHKDKENTEQIIEKKLPRKFSTNTHKTGQNVDPRKTPTASDIKKLCQALEAKSKPIYADRNVAMCMTLWDLGCRISGLLRMNVGDVSYTKDGDIKNISVPPVKSSPRRALKTTVAQPMLKHYLENIHPKPDQKDAPLFCTLKNNECKRIKPRDFSRYLREAKEMKNLDIKFNPHNWRRGRATFLVVKDIFDIRTAASRGGWKDIQIVDDYLQQTMEDVNQKVEQVYKQEKINNQKTGIEADLIPIKCRKCGKVNSGHRKRCKSCQKLLEEDGIPQGPTQEELTETEQKRKKLEGALETLKELGFTPEEGSEVAKQKLDQLQ